LIDAAARRRSLPPRADIDAQTMADGWALRSLV